MVMLLRRYAAIFASAEMKEVLEKAKRDALRDKPL